MAAPTTLRLVDDNEPNPFSGPSFHDVPNETPGVTMKDGALMIENGDGGVTIDFNPDLSEPADDDKDFYANIAGKLPEGELSKISSDLLTGIEYDEESRKEWLGTRATGIRLLGLKLEEPRGDTGTSSAPLEGMSIIRHPLLLEATVRFQATARGELLPASGPVKVRNDAVPKPERMQAPTQQQPAPPPQPGQPPQPGMMGHNQGPAFDADDVGGDQLDELGDALERDMNHYLTVTATEYVPDTDRMLFNVGFGGDGFKKVYNCPLRRRPVSESVDAEDIIVSNAATDMRNCGRVTHRIKMRRSTLRRMQILGAYLDTPLTLPSMAEPVTPVEQAKAAIAGVRPQPQRNEDADYTIYESYCELDIDKFSPKKFRGKGLPLPYVVTIEKDSRRILAIRRNWDEDDEECLAKQFFVQFPFIRGLGFYGLGLIHLLGNVTLTLTAIWREFIDSGMFANFPGFLIAEGAGRQKTNQIRVPPGGSQTVQVPPGMRIADAVTPLPYKEPGPAFTAFVQHVEEVGQRLGQTADVQVGEGKADTPVGTIMAMIEQATKVMDSVHKRLHAAQAEEFQLLKERFREDPEAFWRHRGKRKSTKAWTVELLRQALEQRELVPVADPNNPTSLHRISKAVALLQLAQQHGQFFNIGNVIKRIFRIVGIDVEGLLNDAPTPPPPDPRMEAIQQKAKAQEAMAQIQQFQAVLKQKQLELESQNKQQDRESKEKIEQMHYSLEQLRLQQAAIVHAHELQNNEDETKNKIEGEQHLAATKMITDHMKTQAKVGADMQMAQGKAQSLAAETQAKQQMQREAHDHEMGVERERTDHDIRMEHARSGIELERDRVKHEQEMRHTEEKHAAEIEHKKALVQVARAQAKAKPKPTKGKK
jgi:hypothetical protein